MTDRISDETIAKKELLNVTLNLKQKLVPRKMIGVSDEAFLQSREDHLEICLYDKRICVIELTHIAQILITEITGNLIILQYMRKLVNGPHDHVPPSA